MTSLACTITLLEISGRSAVRWFIKPGTGEVDGATEQGHTERPSSE